MFRILIKHSVTKSNLSVSSLYKYQRSTINYSTIQDFIIEKKLENEIASYFIFFLRHVAKTA